MTKFALYVPLQAKPGKEKEAYVFDYIALGAILVWWLRSVKPKRRV